MSDPYRIVEVSAQPTVIEVDPFRVIDVETNRVVEVDLGETRIIHTTDVLNYLPNKMVFVAGTTGTPVTTGDKQTYGTRFGDGTIHQWVVTTNSKTTLTARIQRSTVFPVFTDILTISLSDNDYATGTVDIPLTNLDVLNLAIDDNTVASKISIELWIR
jgi:hypothetical protein